MCLASARPFGLVGLERPSPGSRIAFATVGFPMAADGETAAWAPKRQFRDLAAASSLLETEERADWYGARARRRHGHQPARCGTVIVSASRSHGRGDARQMTPRFASSLTAHGRPAREDDRGPSLGSSRAGSSGEDQPALATCAERRDRPRVTLPSRCSLRRLLFIDARTAVVIVQGYDRPPPSRTCAGSPDAVASWV